MWGRGVPIGSDAHFSVMHSLNAVTEGILQNLRTQNFETRSAQTVEILLQILRIPNVTAKPLMRYTKIRFTC